MVFGRRTAHIDGAARSITSSPFDLIDKSEATWQWQHFMRCPNAFEFKSTASAAWTRSWVTSDTGTVTLSQQIMVRVVEQ